MTPDHAALRVTIYGHVQGIGFRDATTRRAHELGVLGWVRNGADGTVQAHIEGAPAAVDELLAFLRTGPPHAQVTTVETEPTAPEGHEQFAIRGIPAGVFVVQEHAATTHHFDLRLEVDGAIPKGPSMDPAVKRLAVQVEDHAISHNTYEESGRVIVWDQGTYEQGGRVRWPEALTRGHAVFALHGQKLHGGFALQRTRAGDKPQWLLIKRRDADALPGSDVVVERPESVVSMRTALAYRTDCPKTSPMFVPRCLGSTLPQIHPKERP